MAPPAESESPAGGAPADPATRFAAALAAAESSVDWVELGRLYCHEGGENFFPPEQREAIRDAALRFAGDLGAEFERASAGPGRSLYVGAGVAELALLLCEPVVFGREAIAVNLEGPEVDQLDRALAAAETASGTTLGRFVTGGLSAVRGRFDLVWLVSVLNDPVAYPELSAELYDRPGADPPQVAAQRSDAEALLEDCLDRLHLPGVLATTDEELAIVEPLCRARGLALSVPERGRLSGIVGDVVRLCRVTLARTT